MSSFKKLHHNTDSTLYLLNNTILKICSHRFKHVSVNEGKINQHFLTNPIQEHCGIILFYASIFQIEKVQCSESGRKKKQPTIEPFNSNACCMSYIRAHVSEETFTCMISYPAARSKYAWAICHTIHLLIHAHWKHISLHYSDYHILFHWNTFFKNYYYK